MKLILVLLALIPIAFGNNWAMAYPTRTDLVLKGTNESGKPCSLHMHQLDHELEGKTADVYGHWRMGRYLQLSPSAEDYKLWIGPKQWRDWESGHSDFDELGGEKWEDWLDESIIIGIIHRKLTYWPKKKLYHFEKWAEDEQTEVLYPLIEERCHLESQPNIPQL